METPSADDNEGPTEHTWCPEVVEIMAKDGQTPADFIDSDGSDEESRIMIHDGMDIQNSDGEPFPTHDTAKIHLYATNTAKAQLVGYYLLSKSRFEAPELA